MSLGIQLTTNTLDISILGKILITYAAFSIHPFHVIINGLCSYLLLIIAYAHTLFDTVTQLEHQINRLKSEQN